MAYAEESQAKLAAYVAESDPTALLVMRNGRILLSHGEPARKVSVASVRKSLLGALYGIAVAEGRIRLTDTLAALGIDDRPPSLTAEEKRATVADLLASRSGVYHPAAYETQDMRERRPARGSHAPGGFWFYNNWDFNALGTIYRKATGEDIFEAFARRIARPLGMQDYAAGDGRYVTARSSDHPAYVFTLTARDMLRFGALVAAQGRWDGRQIVPAAWLADSLTARSSPARPGLGYGLLWWTLPAERFGAGAGFAAGHGGQFIAVAPERRLVVAQTIDRRPAAASGTTRRFVRLLNGLEAG